MASKLSGRWTTTTWTPRAYCYYYTTLSRRAACWWWCTGGLPSASTGGMYRTVRTRARCWGAGPACHSQTEINNHLGLAESECEARGVQPEGVAASVCCVRRFTRKTADSAVARSSPQTPACSWQGGVCQRNLLCTTTTGPIARPVCWAASNDPSTATGRPCSRGASWICMCPSSQAPNSFRLCLLPHHSSVQLGQCASTAHALCLLSNS